MRSFLWDSDAPIADVENWITWFDERKIDGPRKEVEAMRANREQGERDWKKWVAAIPKGLEPVWEDSLNAMGEVDTKPLMKALKTSIPKNPDQIRALLEWFGSGVGSWSGFPTYESAAEELLCEYPIDEIVAVVDVKKLTPAQIEGAARLLCGGRFSATHPNGLEKVPAEIKQALWEHVKDTKDEDNLGRARDAFGPKG